MVDPHSARRPKDPKWSPAEHNAYHQNRAEAYRRKQRKRKATLEMQKRARALR